jgi:signal transduction histidine kinase/tetratricopeptide (TPR) repeat protein
LLIANRFRKFAVNPMRLSQASALIGLLCAFAICANAQAPIDTIFNTLRSATPEETAAYLHEVLRPKRMEAGRIKSYIAVKRPELPPANLSVLYAYIGELCMEGRDLKQGYAFLREARQLAQNTGDFPMLNFYYKFSETFKNIPRLDSAVFYGRKMLELSREMKNDSIEIEALELVGSLYYDAGQFNQCIPYYRNIINKTSDRTEKRNAYNTIALCYRNMGVYDSALFYFQPALQHTSPGDSIYLGLINGNIGDTYFLKKQYQQALPYLLRELNFTSNLPMNKIGLDCMNTLAELYLKIDDVPSAKKYHNIINGYLNTPQGTPAIKLNFYRLSTELYKKLGDYKTSLDYLNRYHHIKDSLAALRSSEHVAEISAQYDFEQQRKEIQLLNQRARVQEAENKQKSLLLTGSLIILLLITALLFVLYINNRQKQESYVLVKQHSEYVEQVNEELRVNMEKMEEKNKQIFKLADRLQEANSSKDKMFSIISHDLKSPIHTLKGMLSLVANAQMSQEEFLQFSPKLKAGVEHIDFTMNNLLQWARSQMQGMQTHTQCFDLHPIAKENFDFLAEIAQRKNISLSNTIAKGTIAFADKDQVNIVIRNLISNAIKFTPENGQVTVGALHEDKRMIVVKVQDTGRGMDAETISTLFDKEEHFTSAGTHGEKGSGLGLMLCREMISNNQGKMWVESAEGKGATFFFTLPVPD